MAIVPMGADEAVVVHGNRLARIEHRPDSGRATPDPASMNLRGGLGAGDILIRHIVRTIWNDYRWHLLAGCGLLGLVGLLNGFTIVSVLPAFELLQKGEAGDSSVARFFGSLLASFHVRISLVSLFLLVAAMTLLKAVCFVGQDVLFQYIQIRMDIDRKDEIFRSLMKTDMAYLYQRNFGQLTNVIVRETNMVALLVEYLSRFAIGMVNALVYVLAVLVVDWKLTLLTAALSAAAYVLIRSVFKKARRMGYHLAQLSGRIQEIVHTALFGYKNAKTYVIEAALITRLRAVMDQWKRVGLKLIFTESVLKSFFEPLVVVVAITVFLVCRIELAVFVAFVAVLLRMNQEVREVQKTHYKIARNVGSLQMYLETVSDLRSRPYPEESVGRSLVRLDRGLTFEQVCYTYKTGKDSFTLGPVNMEIPRAKMTALVGPSGSGKSTLIDLAAALLIPDSGRILVDGVDMRAHSLTAYRRRVGYVTQDIFLLNDTVLNNIVFWDETVSLEDARLACDMAFATEFIAGLPDGFGTVLGEHGARLSGGQKQRISLARALARKPEILILDEATSALDTESERRIQEAIENLSGSMTIIAIAHRLSTVKNADYLYVLEDGKIVEQGTYDDLLVRKGRLFTMHTVSELNR